jgi:hypothetical protein
MRRRGFVAGVAAVMAAPRRAGEPAGGEAQGWQFPRVS